MAQLHIGDHDFPQTEFRQMKPSGAAIAASTNAIPFQLDVGWRYKALYIDTAGSGAFTAANFAALRLYANNQPIQQWASGTDLDADNQYDGLPAFSTYGVMVLPFERIGLFQEPWARYKSWINTGVRCPQADVDGGINDFRLEIDVGAATTPALTVYAEVADTNGEQSVVLPRVDYVKESITAGQENQLVQIPNRFTSRDELKAFVHRLMFVDTLAHLTKLRWIADGNETFQNLTTNINELLNKEWKGVGKTPQAGYIHFDFGRYGEARNLIQASALGSLDVRLTAAAGAANPLTVYYKSLGPLV